MSTAAITIENLGKSYRLGRSGTATQSLLRSLRSLAGRGTEDRGGTADDVDTLWALRDINFEVQPGEVLGIIGRNGAGKSTLLKILSRITAPTTGRALIRGRVSSLLEVGTGFHPELTGRENIYMNGSILGMRRAEIDRKFDEIVDFSGVERFLDTPIKRYSSGMQVRLAFAVAAHLEPEILVIDEVLAVGDAEFQRRCLAKMDQVHGAGRTVIFVSHQLDMIRALCSRCVLLVGGRVLVDAAPHEALERYADSAGETHLATFDAKPDADLPLQVMRARLLNGDGTPSSVFDLFDPITLEVEYVVNAPISGAVVSLELKSNGASVFLSFDTDVDPGNLHTRTVGLYKRRVEIPCPLLKPGSYSVSLGTGIANVQALNHAEDALRFVVELSSRPETFLSYARKRPGAVAVSLPWKAPSDVTR